MENEDLLTIYDCGEHLFSHLRELIVRLLVIGLLDLRDMPIRINDKDFAKRHTDIHIAHGIRLSIAKSAVKRRLFRRE